MKGRPWIRDVAWLLGLAAVTAVVFQCVPLDLWVQRRLFAAELAPEDWYLKRTAPWLQLRDYGTLPALTTAVGAMLVLAASLWQPRYTRLRLPALYLVLALVLGPGLVVNHVFKLNWGRPRPDQVEAFGGYMPYHEALEPGVRGRGRSFPCGHSSVGFYFTAGYLLLRRRRPRAARRVLGGSLVLGGLIGFGRMAAGAHFLSDVVWSGLMVHGTNLALYYGLRLPAHEDGGGPSWRLFGSRRLLAAAGALLAVGAAVGLGAATARYRRAVETSGPLDGMTPVDVVVSGGVWNVSVSFEPRADAEFEFEGRGFGFPWSDLIGGLETSRGVRGPEVAFVFNESGWFSETDVRLHVRLPQKGIGKVVIYAADGMVRVGPPGRRAGAAELEVHPGRASLTLAPYWAERRGAEAGGGTAAAPEAGGGTT